MRTAQRALIVVAMLALSDGASTSAQSAFREGEPFPPIVLPTVSATGAGEPRSVADFRGEKIILHMFASW